jgi:L-asparagine transporter-like permease
MLEAKQTRSSKQQIFRDTVLGTLLYAVVLGFFNDYTDILTTRSYSITFACAFVLQVLTYLTLMLKGAVVNHHNRKAASSKLLLALSVWLILFLSKFVFLAVLDAIFDQDVEISGFVGLLAIIICLTLAQKAVEYTYKRLSD